MNYNAPTWVNGSSPAINAQRMQTLCDAVEQDGIEIQNLQTQQANPFTFKGDVTATTDLPSTGNTINDTYYVTDDSCLYSWNGTDWIQSSLSEADYLTLIESVAGDIAAEYNSASTYSVGDYCIYDYVLYRCNTEISTAENWNSAHWTSINFAEEISDLKNAIRKFGLRSTPTASSAWEQGGISPSTGSNVSSNYWIRMNVVPSNVDIVTAMTGYKFRVFGYDESRTFLGIWDGSTHSFKKPSTATADQTFTEINLNDVNADSFKLVGVKADASQISPSDASNIVFSYIGTDTTLTQPGKIADAKVTGDRLAMVESASDIKSSYAMQYDMVADGHNPQPSDSYYDRIIKLPSWMQNGTHYKILLRFNGFTESQLTNTMQKFYVAGGLNGGTLVEDIKATLVLNGLYTKRGDWIEADYTPAQEITYFVIIYSSGYSSATNSIDWAIFNVDKPFAIVKRMDNGFYFGTPINTFGDVLPLPFKSKLLNQEQDILIAFVGDSITGKTEYCDMQSDPAHCPAGAQRKSWTYLIWEYISKKIVTCDRLDSVRDSESVFTTVGTWEQIVGGKFDESYNGDTASQENSVTSLTYQSLSDDASVQFAFDASTYEKCNIVYSKEYDGADCEIVIAEGNGKMLVSEDRMTWVEANGYQHTQISDFANGQRRQRHRKLWMKKATGVTGNITITYKKSATQTLETNYIYCWGIERWKGNAVFCDNLGRGSFSTFRLAKNALDIFDRHPDLAVYEMPLANETGNGNGFNTTKGFYKNYFVDATAPDGSFSYRELSNNYADVPLLIVLPHNRGTAYDTNNQAIFDTLHQMSGDPISVVFYKRIFAYLQDQLSSYGNVKFVNLCDRLYNESVGLGVPYKVAFGMNSNVSLTEDTTHLNQRGANAWAKYLVPIFQQV